MPDQQKSVVYGRLPASALTHQHVATTTLPFEEILERLRQSIQDKDLWVLHEINPQAIVARDSFVIGQARQILFFHPRLMARILAADPALLLEAPLKVAVMELAPDETIVRWFDPEPNFARYGDPDLAALGKEFATTFHAIVQAALA